MILLLILCILPIIIYLGNLLLGNIGLLLLKTKTYEGYTPFVSIIIAAKNEEKNIEQTLSCVLNQTYPRDKFEVILVDDASEDRTNEIAQGFLAKYSNLVILNQPAVITYQSRKKYALENGIKKSRGEILLFTDADSRMSKHWVKAMISCYDPEGTIGAVCSFVCLPHKKKSSLFMRFQELDYLSISLMGAGYFGIGYPACNNGNNFSYRKKLFYQVNGFNGIENVKSGDDDLLLEKFTTMTDKKIAYCYDKNAIVETAPVYDIKGLLNQRSRWASKVFIYKRLVYTIMMLGIFLFNLFLCVSPLILLLLPQSLFLVSGSVLGKIILEGMLFIPRLLRLHRKALIAHLFLLSLLYAPYIVYVGLAGVLGNFEWKSDALTSLVKPGYVHKSSEAKAENL